MSDVTEGDGCGQPNQYTWAKDKLNLKSNLLILEVA
jgi:hypothetical protein